MSNIKLVHSGGNSVSLTTPTSNPASNITFKLPQADGSANQVLQTDGNGNLSWVSLPTGGLANAVQFRMTQDQQQDNGNAHETLLPWEKVDDTHAGQIGSFTDPSSGIFTFPSTGIWRIDFNSRHYNGSSRRHCDSMIMATTNNSSYDIMTRARAWTEAGDFLTLHSCYIMDVTSVSTHKVKFNVRAENGDVYHNGETTENETYVTFMRLGDT